MSEKKKTFRSLTIESNKKTTFLPFLKRYNSPNSLQTYQESKKRLSNESLFNNFQNSINYNIGNKYYYRHPTFYNDGNLNNQINLLLTSSGNKYENRTFGKKLGDTTNKDFSNRSFSHNKIKVNEFLFPPFTIDDKIKTNLKYTTCSTDYDKDNTDPNLKKSPEEKRKDNIEHFYKCVFSTKPIVKSKYDKYIDNKLNLVYSENLQQFKTIMERRKLEKNNKVMSSKDASDNEKIVEQVNDIKTKINFMKSILDYSTPHFLLTKAKAIVSQFHNDDTEDITSTPVEKRIHEAREKNEIRRNYFTKSMNVMPLKI